MARIWQNGFELGYNKTLKSDTVLYDNFKTFATEGNMSNNVCLAGVQDITRGGLGTRSLLLQGKAYYNGYAAYVDAEITFTQEPFNEVFFRGYFYPSVAHSSFDMLFIKDSNLKQLLKVRLVKINSTDYSLIFYNASDTQMYEFKILNFNEWVKLDLRLLVDKSSGTFQFKINDRLITTWTGDTQGSNGLIKNIMLHMDTPTNADYHNVSQNIYWDDVAINDTTGNVNNGWCGNGSIIQLLPYANGSINQFTPMEGTSNFENVDEETPDGDTTYNSSYALEDTDLFKFKLPETVGEDDIINAIIINTQGKFLEQPLNIEHVTSTSGQEVITKNFRLSNAYVNYSSIFQVNPKTNGRYKASEFNNDLEIGYRTKDFE